MKTIFKGMVLLLAGASFVACSKDVSFDENAQKQAEEAKKQAELDQKYATYDAEFVKAFGTIAKGHDWGFGAAATRGEAMPGKNHNKDNNYDCGYELPKDITSYKEGPANKVQTKFKEGKGVDINELVLFKDFVFSYYWMQHANKAQGNHRKMVNLEAYASNGNDWIDVTNFDYGDNTTNTYYVGKTKLKGTTLMLDMGGAGDPENDYKLFRWIDSNNKYHYDYKFYEYTTSDGKNLLFLGLPYDINNIAGDWWIILIAEAVPKDPTKKVAEAGRVFCEDMGTIGDFDFNDVVFDAWIYQNGEIDIEILAAGGTLPISVAETPVTLGEMTNTGYSTSGITVEPQKIHLNANSDKSPKYATIKDIPVVVTPGGGAIPYVLKADPDAAPQKICTYINANWPDEYVRIEKAYPQFEEWVGTYHPSKWVDEEITKFTDLDLTNNK